MRDYLGKEVMKLGYFKFKIKLIFMEKNNIFRI